MITRSICIWIAVFFVFALLMNPVISREKAHEQRLLELDEDIAEIRKKIKQESQRKPILLRRCESLTESIARERKLGEEAKSILQERPRK